MKFQKNNLPLQAEAKSELSISGEALTNLIQDVLSKKSPFRFRAKGFSMSPFIKDGDFITLSPLFSAPPLLGDVVAFVHPKTGKLIIHRVVGKKGDSYFIKGDSTSEIDDIIPRAKILGRVTEVKRDKKKIVLGFGPERLLIAFLTRRKLFFVLLLPVWRIVRPLARRLFR